ncbi:MAG TPA: alpha-amylase family glycosyl hydrolase, partial [Verrucomicrobiae bacterium]|nr:alpha-amylase family glycosyl hydrolase [Verrucomicrobiae bacterium]
MRPVLYEINTRRWLRELAADAETPVTLDRVPESEFLEWTRLGFTHIWLMGVWKTGPLARAEALRAAAMRDQYARALENFTDADIEGSPYAIAEYAAASEFGGTEALRVFRKRLNEYGLKLILDFVPNHVGLDHPWLRDRPDFFVQSASATAETFERETAQGRRWFAHGKDPYFPSWTDTAQLDYRRRATQAAMMDALSGVAALCDGVRCDMAMLVLNDVFAKTWARFPLSDPEPNFEFWELAIPAVKASRPGFVFLAEAYWGIEPRLQALGFDYTYDKELYDRLVANDPPGVQRHLLNHPLSEISAGAHFLENHDEARAASVFSFARHRAAAALILALPGMVLLHEGQLEGLMKRVPVQLVRAEEEPSKPEIQQMYEELLAAFAG